MAFVSRTSLGALPASGAWSVSLSASAGDVLVAVVHAHELSVSSGAADVSRFDAPGWHGLGMWSAIASGSPQVRRGVVAVLWRPVTASGSAHGAIRWPGRGGVAFPARLDILRYSGMKAITGVSAWYRSVQRAIFPPVQGRAAPSGHALRFAVTAPSGREAAQFVPPSHSQRLAEQIGTEYRGGFGLLRGWAVVSDQTLTSTTPDAVEAQGAGSGWTITAHMVSQVAPDPPVIVEPSESVADLSVPWTLRWIPDGEQRQVRVYREYRNTEDTAWIREYLTSITSPAWSASETTLTTSATSVDFPAGMFEAGGKVYEFGVRTAGGPGRDDFSGWEAIGVHSWQEPTASNVSAGGALVGGVLDSRRPWITVDGTPGTGATIDLHEIEITDATTGETLSRGTYTPGWWHQPTVADALDNGATVYLRGRVRQRGVQWSDWVQAGPYLVDAPRPDPPTVTVAPIEHPDSGLPGAAVTIVTPIAGIITLYRDGEQIGQWDTTGSVTIADYGLPVGGEVVYTATITTLDELPETSLPGEARFTLTGDGDGAHCWLMDPLDPSTAVQAHCVAFEERDPHPVSVHHALRDRTAPPIVIDLPPWTPSGSLTVETVTATDEARARRLLTAGRPLLYRRWVEHTGDTRPDHAVPPLRFIPSSGVEVTRPIEGPFTRRHLSVEWETTP